MNTIVIAVDGSPASCDAVEFGVELAEEQGAEIAFVHVIPQYEFVPMNAFGPVTALEYEPKAGDVQMLDDAAAAAERRCVPARTKILRGDTVDEIVTYADNLDADMIVVGSRGHGRWASAILGSVSKGVLNESKRPVVIVTDASVARSSRPLSLTR